MTFIVMALFFCENMADRLRDMMDEAPDERTRQEIARMIDKIDS